MKYKIHCLRCKKIIYRPLSKITNRTFCSLRCSRITEKIESACKVCGKVKLYMPGDLRKNGGFCSTRCSKVNEFNPQWKGKKVGYVALHVWVKSRLKKPDFCQVCKKNPPYDLANISQKYKRDLSDWEWLCRSCHMNSDGRIKNLNQYNKRISWNKGKKLPEFSGINSSNWKGGISLNQKLYDHQRYLLRKESKKYAMAN